MFCNQCGAGLRDTDRYCPQCGASVDGSDGKNRRVTPEPEIFYDEKLYKDDRYLYKDTFLDKKEERSHALLVTVTLLLVMAVLASAVIILFFFYKKGQPGGNVQTVAIDEETEVAYKIQWIPLSDEEIAGEHADEKTAGKKEKETQEADGGQLMQVPVSAEGQRAETDTEDERETETAIETETEIKQDRGPDMSYAVEMLEQNTTASKAAVYVCDLKHLCDYASENCDEPMYASALISVPILYTAAVMLDQREITLNDMVTYVNSIGGRGEAYPEQKDGQAFPLSYYLTTMMSYSDNNCMNCLIDYLGLERINAVCHQAGYTSVDLQRKIVDEVTDGKDNYLSASDMAGMVRDLYQGKFRTISREFLKQYFKIDSGDGYRTVLGLSGEIPADAMFLNQNGRGDTRYNEVAVIADGNCQYVISMMLNGDPGFEYEAGAEELSGYVYRELAQEGSGNS